MAIIEVVDLVKRYGAKTAVDGVSFTVDEGEIFGILGPNGAGKTTTVECVGGLRAADSGTIRVAGLDPRRDRVEVRRLLGAQLQESRLPERIRVGEALALYASFYPDPVDWHALLDRLGLADRVDVEYRKLSGGQKQRVSIALALVGGPRVAVLDELTTGLDPAARRETWDLVERVRASGVTVLLVTHFMEEAERLCDRIAVIDQGRVVAVDTPAGLVSRVDARQRVRFRPVGAFDADLLRALPEVTDVEEHGGRVVVTGTGELLHAVTSLLARNQVVAAELRVDQPGLDDAFLHLTGRAFSEVTP
ncbi:ABC transporter ATP-binding protein [Saccharothrix violaceirubra]|uniref:ABC-2 type transport system ATP-binding protein n=1 Tax=Saccharothrix violaceirubra TaxID=413306 RepID=A0A7W7T4Z3_9PSEU|nr:ABC transporter ATP-binding protein [Saccharothrix violaceirubra]MBB4966689.1 ABC-2 type transport system ATP-binding protein [Saccharothrix violaceirubra]